MKAAVSTARLSVPVAPVGGGGGQCNAGVVVDR